MIRKGFDTERYLEVQVQKILERTGLFDKLYLEFGGKLRYDNHAARVLPGFALDTKMRMLEQLGESIEITHCISAQEIKGRKIRRDCARCEVGVDPSLRRGGGAETLSLGP